MKSVLIADDHAVVRAGYRVFLTADADVGDVGEATTAAEVLQQLRGRPWTLLILDIHLPDRTGMEVLREARRDFPKTHILVVSGLPEDQYGVEALRAGAAGFLSKECAPEELLEAMRRVCGGRRYVSARLADQMVAALGKPTSPRHEQLSARERQVFNLIAGGGTISGIARQLSLSIKTVSTYRTRTLEKMCLESNADITSYAVRRGLPYEETPIERSLPARNAASVARGRSSPRRVLPRSDPAKDCILRSDPQKFLGNRPRDAVAANASCTAAVDNDQPPRRVEVSGVRPFGFGHSSESFIPE